MGNCRSGHYWAIALAWALTSAGHHVWALPHWKPRPAGPVTAYAPQMRHFVVVAPVPAVTAPYFAPPASPQSAAAVQEQVIPSMGGQREALVEPRVAHHTRVKAKAKKAIAPAAPVDQVLWQQQVEPVPVYPWGWFGARRHTENFGHRRYSGGELDWTLRRGD